MYSNAILLTTQLCTLSQAAKEASSQALCAEISYSVTSSTTSLPSKMYLELDLRKEELKKERKANLVKNLVSASQQGKVYTGSCAVVREDSKHQERSLCQCEDR